MITFKVVERDNESVVLILRDEKLIAVIHGHEEGVRLVSEYYDGVQSESGVPLSVIIKLYEGGGKR